MARARSRVGSATRSATSGRSFAPGAGDHRASGPGPLDGVRRGARRGARVGGAARACGGRAPRLPVTGREDPAPAVRDGSRSRAASRSGSSARGCSIAWVCSTAGSTIAVTVVLGLTSIAALIGPGRPTLRALRGRQTAIFAGWAGGSTLLGAAPLCCSWSSTSATPGQLDPLVLLEPGAPDRRGGRYAGPFVRVGDVGQLPRRVPGFTPATTVFALAGGTGTLAAAHAVTVIAMLSAGLAIFLLVHALGGQLWGAAFRHDPVLRTRRVLVEAVVAAARVVGLRVRAAHPGPRARVPAHRPEAGAGRAGRDLRRAQPGPRHRLAVRLRDDRRRGPGGLPTLPAGGARPTPDAASRRSSGSSAAPSSRSSRSVPGRSRTSG